MLTIDESTELGWEDMKLLLKWGVLPDSSNARTIVLIGRLQRALKVDNDGLIGPVTLKALRQQEPFLGPELSDIVRRSRTVRGFKQWVAHT